MLTFTQYVAALRAKCTSLLSFQIGRRSYSRHWIARPKRANEESWLIQLNGRGSDLGQIQAAALTF